MISEQARGRMRSLAARYPMSRSALLPVLHIAQEEEGYITSEGISTIAEILNLTTDDVKSVATFYTMYYQHPHGQKVINVCTGISCYLRGCDQLMEHLEQRLGVKRGETTPDGNFTLEGMECLASCGTAPVLQINSEFVENVTLEMADALLDELGRELKAKKVLQSPQGGSTERIK
ncbi:MAG TPA: NADH-quinone oxidoreductase subunit NuoE [Ktedonobacteraceae bacterium]